MTTREKLERMQTHEQNNRQRVEEYLQAGKTHVPPAIAGKLLGCDPYSLNLAAKHHHLPHEAYYYAGRNCKISLRWLASQL